MELPDKEILVKDLFQASIAALEKFQIMIGSDAVKGIALDVTAYYGDIRLSLLTSEAEKKLEYGIMDVAAWDYSTNYEDAENSSKAFDEYWGKWETFFYEYQEKEFIEDENIHYEFMLSICCEAMTMIEESTIFDSLKKADDILILILEHDEPEEYALKRYSLYKDKGIIEVFNPEF